MVFRSRHSATLTRTASWLSIRSLPFRPFTPWTPSFPKYRCLETSISPKSSQRRTLTNLWRSPRICCRLLYSLLTSTQLSPGMPGSHSVGSTVKKVLGTNPGDILRFTPPPLYFEDFAQLPNYSGHPTLKSWWLFLFLVFFVNSLQVLTDLISSHSLKKYKNSELWYLIGPGLCL